MTLIADDHVPDDAFAAARNEFAEKELADLTLAVGLINAYNRMAISFRRIPASVAKLATGAWGDVIGEREPLWNLPLQVLNRRSPLKRS